MIKWFSDRMGFCNFNQPINEKMKKVLIALDYNPVSEKVAEEGYKLAQKMDAEVCLIHVMADVSYYGTQYPPFMGFEGYAGMTTDYDMVNQMHEIGEDYLEKAATHLNDPSVKTHMAEGDTAKAILDYAGEWNADLIVMGTHSHSTLEKILMGTVASSVLERTKVPVYMVPVNK